MRMAMDGSAVIVALMSEKALAIAREMPSWDTVLSQYEMALDLVSTKNACVLPVYVGQVRAPCMLLEYVASTDCTCR